MRLREVAIRDLVISIVIVGATMSHSSEVEDFRIGTPNNSLISFKVILVSQFLIR